MSCRTAVIVPNYNGKEYLKDCFDSLTAQDVTPERIVMVDNGSDDGSVEFVRAEYPQVEIRCLGENTGFCGAVNEGIRYCSDADLVILLNNDTRVMPGFVGALRDAMERYPRAFSCQAKMLRMKEPDRIDDAGDLYSALGWAFARGKGKDEKRYKKNVKVFSCCAGAAVYRRSLFDELGLFDEAHFAYLEDVDLGWRALLRGYENRFEPEAKVLHVGSASSGSIYNTFKVHNSSRNNYYLLSKNMPLWQKILNAPLLSIGFLIKYLFFASKGHGKTYRKGILEGMKLARGFHGTRYYKGAKGQLQALKIQLWLWINAVRRL